MTEKDPLPLYLPLGPLRLEGLGSLECARSVATGQRVCLRKVPASPAAFAAFDRALALPKHPALSAALECGVWQGEAWLATDFPEGQLLGDGSDASWNAQTLAAEFQPIAEALAALHQAGGVHGVLSGEAVLKTASGVLTLHEVAMLDLNRITDRRPEQTALAQLQRTAAYFSPQRLKGGPPTAADDVYALGALLCVSAGGARLARSSALEQLHAVMVGSWKPAPPAGLPDVLARLLERMVSADPALRPTATEVAERLRTPSFVAPFVFPAAPPPPVLVPVAPATLESFAIPHPMPTAPGAPVFDPIPAPAMTAPYTPFTVQAFPVAVEKREAPKFTIENLIAPPLPLPTVPTPLRAPPPPPTAPSPPPAMPRIHVGGAAATADTFELRWPLLGAVKRHVSGFTISIAASDARLVTAGLVAIAMLASTVALGAHVVSARNEAKELASAQVIKPVARKEPRYNAEQLKQILRQKEAVRHEY